MKWDEQLNVFLLNLKLLFFFNHLYHSFPLSPPTAHEAQKFDASVLTTISHLSYIVFFLLKPLTPNFCKHFKQRHIFRTTTLTGHFTGYLKIYRNDEQHLIWKSEYLTDIALKKMPPIHYLQKHVSSTGNRATLIHIYDSPILQSSIWGLVEEL